MLLKILLCRAGDVQEWRSSVIGQMSLLVRMNRTEIEPYWHWIGSFAQKNKIEIVKFSRLPFSSKPAII